MRTEIIGLNAWLTEVQVSDTTALCLCGWHAQTVRHVLLHYPRHERLDLIQKCGTERIDDIFLHPVSAKHAARWLT
jgi:hypothetical protein